MRVLIGLLLGLCLLSPAVARAAGACVLPPPSATATLGQRVASLACAEHNLWFRPFIDIDGRMASMTVAESESARLADGGTEPWRRVAMYWRDAGLDWRANSSVSAGSCASPVMGSTAALCRATIIDNPWSAAFVSWLMARAGVPGFRRSASHYDYVGQAGQGGGPYSLHDPATTAPGVGDLLCFVRANSTSFGHAGLRRQLASGSGGLAMHCDVVVGTDAARGRVDLVGGNVLQGVTMRSLHLNRSGLLWNLPPRVPASACTPDNPSMCSFNRQDWVALLKFDLAGQAAAPWQPERGLLPAPRQDCCVNCVVGSGIPRCPVATEPVVPAG